jgi:hypothetical protein
MGQKYSSTIINWIFSSSNELENLQIMPSTSITLEEQFDQLIEQISLEIMKLHVSANMEVRMQI